MSSTAGWFDSHCHLDMFDDPDSVLERAQDAGVGGVVTIGTDLESSRKAVELATHHDGVWATAGIHPHDSSSYGPDVERELDGIADLSKVVAIGEVGLDYYRDLSPRDRQREAFIAQIAICKAHDLALVIHMRDAHDGVFRILGKEGPVERLVFHCFSGGETEARRALDLGGLLSFAGNVSYRRSEELREAARICPSDRLLVETDSPFLAPEPHRGKSNEPAFVPLVGVALAEARGESPAGVAETTSDNARRVFRLE